MSHAESDTKTYVTQLTPAAPAAISVIEIAGPRAESWLSDCWKPATELTSRIGVIRYGAWVGPSTAANSQRQHTISSEDVVVCWTDSQTVEIHCHGGKQAAERIRRDLKELGATPRSIQSRTSDQISDPTRAAAMTDLNKATTEITTSILLDQYRGALSQSFTEIQELTSQGKNKEALSVIEKLLAWKPFGLHLTQPWRLAIIGPPNAGKSSLLNAILGYDRAIVDSVAGTTRDALNEHTSLLGWPFVIIDTAGLRDTNDPIESEGVNRAHSSINTSDLVLLVVEPQQGWTSWHDQVYLSNQSKCLAVLSKADLGLSPPAFPEGIAWVSTSAATRFGIEEMYQAIVVKLIPVQPLPGAAIPFRPEQIALLEKWQSDLTSSTLSE